MISIDIIVAVRNEEESVPVFIEHVRRLQLPEDIELGLLFVEDSSTDQTRVVLSRASSADSHVRYYSLVRGYGQCAAIIFGMSRSNAAAVIMMDGDSSHPIDTIPELIRRFRDGAQVVQCVRRTLTDRKLYRRAGASVYRALFRGLTGIDPREQMIYYRLVSSDVVAWLLRRPRYWRYLRFPLPRQPDGALAIVEVDSRDRELGRSKYNFSRLTGLAIDGVLSQIAPTRLAVIVALALAIAFALSVTGVWILGICVAALAVVAGLRFLMLDRSDVLHHIRIAESSQSEQQPSSAETQGMTGSR